MTIAPSFYLGIGDDWVMPVTYRNPPNPDGSPGAPIDLTGSTVGGELYLNGHNEAVRELTLANGGIIASSPADGAFTFMVPKSLANDFAIAPDNPLRKDFPNRLQVWIVNSLGQRGTEAIYGLFVFNPRTVSLEFISQIPQNQSATIVAAGAQGPAGPAGPAISVNGHIGLVQTVTAHDVGTYTSAEIDAAILAAVAPALTPSGSMELRTGIYNPAWG